MALLLVIENHNDEKLANALNTVAITNEDPFTNHIQHTTLQFELYMHKCIECNCEAVCMLGFLGKTQNSENGCMFHTNLTTMPSQMWKCDLFDAHVCLKRRPTPNQRISAMFNI